MVVPPPPRLGQELWVLAQGCGILEAAWGACLSPAWAIQWELRSGGKLQPLLVFPCLWEGLGLKGKPGRKLCSWLGQAWPSRIQACGSARGGLCPPTRLDAGVAALFRYFRSESPLRK